MKFNSFFLNLFLKVNSRQLTTIHMKNMMVEITINSRRLRRSFLPSSGVRRCGHKVPLPIGLILCSRNDDKTEMFESTVDPQITNHRNSQRLQYQFKLISIPIKIKDMPLDWNVLVQNSVFILTFLSHRCLFIFQKQLKIRYKNI